MHPQIPLTRDIVFIGGGHAHVLALRSWGMNPVPGVRLTLIGPDPTAAYSGMLPGHIAGRYPREALQIDLVRLARFAGARLILGRATGIDRTARRVEVAGRPPVAYDVLSVDIGISSEMPSLPGFAEHAVPAKPLDAFADRWAGFVASAPSGAAVAVIGGGVAGVELALAAAQRLGRDARVTLIEAGKALSAVGRGARSALLRHLARAGVTVIEDCAVLRVDADGVRLADGRFVPAQFTLGAAATRAQGWLADTGLALQDGFIIVDDHLRSVSDPAIFATGDIAHLAHAPRPKAGVFAVRQAPVLLHNLTVAATETGRLRPYRPQRDYLKLISAGAGRAVADKWGLPLDGAWLWDWKDRIDRRFMAKFETLPAMPAPTLPAQVAAGVAEEIGNGKPLCGGCGAKMGRSDLSATLAGLPQPRRPDVIWGTGDDAAILRHGAGAQILTTDHVRAFTEDPWLLARITAIHALGDVWSMGARPQAALVQAILPRMAPRLQRETLREILAGATEVFSGEGADVVGGHTSLGAELTLGYTVTGLSEGPPVTQSGARPGDVLILTKPIGTGVILAAEMARAAPGGVVAAALDSMAHPQGAAARALAPHAHAMTDVTGFGLAGHLLGLLEASGLSARIDLSAVPFLHGAEALAAAGHGSTLLPQNRQAAGRMSLGQGPRADLLFDPQTAGGLLAAVPEAEADAVLAHLRDLGENPARIGRLEEGAPFVTVDG
ncbi:selenide, water dikinase SelD [Albidovulum sediminis]|uniref:Selenide, water dikinase SelD n=1 Tax=Albidovulum sediminis TaxID=3066345 RepID=A0ABT2NRA4_9RHOB|nr:selenide, water dikinase SelD [Defluviimonas sediminis]MCT8331473.1 selenide, water dikinase SelD [Defluviimonas sediminis]